MGLKCSVLGHKYGETTVEREREEQGSEVVITIQERETCERCGNTRIVSENKEVTAIETPSDIAGDLVDDADADAADAEPEGSEFEPPEDDEAEDASDGWDSVDEGVETEPVDPDVGGVGGGGSDEESEPIDPSADDAEIIDDDESDDEAESGDVELDEPTTTVDVPDAEGDDSLAGDETDPEEDDGLILGEEDEEGTSGDREPGAWPEEPGDDGDDWSPETMPVEDDDESDVEPVGENAVTVPEGEFRCPECGFTTEVESTSLRAGDFCPECHKGSLINHRDE
ncbi:zinc ribbon domain-containing protein [Haloarcula salina]|uniref:Uncharacterized protein n=1 Tax=Haloarcula salina TaxID=1429914 RepID=A0AA41G3L2_9EURY|nr:zinc ribbon domain-containing protein [Haloarcula salina]MBV0903651.1 hypothetical protein [Haloarcula salina]